MSDRAWPADGAQRVDLSPTDAAGYWKDVLDMARAARDEFQPTLRSQAAALRSRLGR